MKFIGITGGVGAGKSKILEYLASKPGIRVMLADEIAHDLMEPGTECYERLRKCFEDEDIYCGDGHFDRPKLASVIFSDEKKKVPIEIQFRTIAMNFWASTEHQLRYKSDQETTQKLRQRLQRCAEISARLDEEMQSIYREINGEGIAEKNTCADADFQA